MVATATTNSNVIMEETKKINEQPMAEQEPQFRTVRARIKGEDRNIILACHKYSMETLKNSDRKSTRLNSSHAT